MYLSLRYEKHRFGAPKISEKSVEQEPSKYNTKKLLGANKLFNGTLSELIPTLTPHISEEKPPASEEKSVEIPAVNTEINSKVVKEMQNAWHDWFARTNELGVSNEILLEETPEMPLEDAEEAPEARTDVFDAETTPITLEKVTEVIENKIETEENVEEPEEEEIVPIHRTYRPTTTYQPQVGRSAPMYEPEEQGRIVRERRIIRKRKPSALLQAFLLIIAGVSIVVTVIGSGFADPVLISLVFITHQYSTSLERARSKEIIK